MMAIVRSNVPAIYVYGGTIKPGHWKGKDLTVVSIFEAVGEFSRGRMSEEDFEGIERNAVPGTGSCGGMYTANTMSSVVRSARHEPARLLDHGQPGRREARVQPPSRHACSSRRCAATSSRATSSRANRSRRGDLDHGHRRFHQRRAALPGDRRTRAGVQWTIDDFERVRRKVPVICDLKPSGQYVATDAAQGRRHPAEC